MSTAAYSISDRKKTEILALADHLDDVGTNGPLPLRVLGHCCYASRVIRELVAILDERGNALAQGAVCNPLPTKEIIMAKKWIDLGQKQPARGERCIVWDIETRDSVFAIWDAECKRFCEVPGYHGPRFVAVQWWMPEPEMPD